MIPSVQLAAIAALIFATIGYVSYRALLPRPIPGIPYNLKSASKLLGDIPDVLQHGADTAEMMSFLEKRSRELNSPICQVFVKPFSRPWVILTDGREAANIMSKRGHEFDRSTFIKELLDANFPHSMVSMPTNENWRSNRRLLADTMTASFLNGVGANVMHQQTLYMIETLRHKARHASEHAFDVRQDVAWCTMDTIWAVAFGTELGSSQSQHESLKSSKKFPLPESESALVEFPQAPLPEAYDALLAVISSSEIPMKSPLGGLHHWFAIKFYPSLRRAMQIRQSLVNQKFEQAWKTFSNPTAKGSTHVECATDLLIRQEVKAAQRQGREPDVEAKKIIGEMNAFLGAGYETTSSAVSWGLKYLTAHQDVQSNLRNELYSAFEGTSGQPAPIVVAKTSLPYMDAFIDEVLRHSCITSTVSRIATVDTNVLGYPIPKGTDVIMLNNGASIRYSAVPTNSSKDQSDNVEPKWLHPDLHLFRPERFLTPEGQYDPNAAPNHAFGLGLRGCFGKKLALLEMKIMYALIVWNFELLPLSEELVDWKSIDVIAHQPRRVVVRLKSIVT